MGSCAGQWVRIPLRHNADFSAARLGYLNLRKNVSEEVIGSDCEEQLPAQVASYGGENRVLKMLWLLFSVYVPASLLEQGKGVPPLNFIAHPGPGVLFEWHKHHRYALDQSLKEVAQKHGMDWVDVANKIRVLHYEWFKFYATQPVDDATQADLDLLREISMLSARTRLTSSGLSRIAFRIHDPWPTKLLMVRHRPWLRHLVRWAEGPGPQPRRSDQVQRVRFKSVRI